MYKYITLAVFLAVNIHAQMLQRTQVMMGTFITIAVDEKSKKYIPVVILFCVALEGLIIWAFGGQTFFYSIIAAADDILRFLMIFYIVSIVLGSLLNTSYQTSVYTTFFYRIGLPWVKFSRKVINIPGNGIVIVSIVFVFISYLLLDSGLQFVFSSFLFAKISFLVALKISAKAGLFAIIDLLGILTWLIIIRALLSWVSPDPYNPIVQLIVALTEPVMGPFRKIIPPIGMIDISPIVLIFLIEFVRIFLKRFIGILF